MAQASHYEHLYEVETYCPKKQRTVKLTLGSNIKQNGEIVKGKPIFCNFEHVCSFTKDHQCFLQCQNLETRRLRP
jgi:hypothetical protein